MAVNFGSKPHLDLLAVRWTDMSDNSVPALLRMQRLTEMKIVGTKLTRAGRVSLASGSIHADPGEAFISGTHLPRHPRHRPPE